MTTDFVLDICLSILMICITALAITGTLVLCNGAYRNINKSIPVDVATSPESE